MAYIVDRQQVLSGKEIVAVVGVRQRRFRSRVVCKDNSLYQTLTRPATFTRYLNATPGGIVQIGARRPRRRQSQRAQGGNEEERAKDAWRNSQ